MQSSTSSRPFKPGLVGASPTTDAKSNAECRMRSGEYGMEQLVQTSLGSRVICGERDLLYEEAPAAYKNIEAVILELVDAGVVSVIATFRPLLTYKTRQVK